MTMTRGIPPQNVFGAHDCLDQTIKPKGVVILFWWDGIDLTKRFETQNRAIYVSRRTKAEPFDGIWNISNGV